MLPVTPIVARRESPADGPKKKREDEPANSPVLPQDSSGGHMRQGHSGEQRPLPRVFVVDDEEFIRELYKDVFESNGMTVFSAQSGEEAVRLFKSMKYKPDIIIMDHRMPGKDGIETTKEILKIDPTVPVVFSSADETVREDALAAGAVSFWSKPFPMSMLVSAMKEICEQKRKHSPHHFH